MFELTLWQGQGQVQQTEAALARVNRQVQGYGLALQPQEMHALALRHQQVLRATGRVEFGESVLPALAFAFCDSPNIHPANYAATLDSLMECFYYFKGELRETVSDEELVGVMKRYFDGECQGSVEYLQGTLLERLADGVRFAGFARNADPPEDTEDDWDGEGSDEE